VGQTLSTLPGGLKQIQTDTTENAPVNPWTWEKLLSGRALDGAARGGRGF